MECVLYYDTSEADGDKFNLGTGSESVECFGDTENTPNNPASGDEQVLAFDWGTPAVCTEVSIYKFSDPSNAVDLVLSDGINVRPGTPCPAGAVCTVVQSRGYNVACANRNSVKVVERELTLIY